MKIKQFMTIFVVIAMLSISIVSAVNPTAANNTIEIVEDGNHTFSSSDFGFLDDDGDLLDFITIGTTASVGAFELSGVGVSDADPITLVDIDAGLLVFTPVSDDNGVDYDSFTFTVTDDNGETSDDTYNITFNVTEVNDAPTLVAIGDQAVDEDVELTFDVTGSDVDGETLTITLTVDDFTSTFTTSATLDAGTHFVDNSDNTGTFNWTPTNDDVGTHEVTVNVTDGSGEIASETFDIVVSNINDAPVLASFTNQSATEDTEFTLAVSASDVDDDSADLTLSIVEDAFDSAGTTFDPAFLVDNGDGTADLTWTPTNADVGDHNLTLTVADDGGEESTQEFIITVSEVNDAPVLAAIGEQNIDEDVEAVIGFSATDDDVGASLTLSMVENSFGSPSSSLDVATHFVDNGDGTADLTWTPTNDDVGSHSVTVTVSDGTDTDYELFNIIVANINDAPTITEITDTAAAVNADTGVGIEFSLQTESADVDLTVDVTEALSYDVSSNPAATEAPVIDSNGLLTWTPDNAEIGSTFEFTVEVTDNDGENATESFLITVESNVAPVLESIESENDATQGSLFTLSFNASDADADTLEFTLVEDSFANTFAGSVSTLDNSDLTDNGDGTATLSWTPSNDDVGIHTLTLTVSDGYLSGNQSFNISVANINDAPVLSASVEDQDVDEDTEFSLDIVVSDPDEENVTFKSFDVDCDDCKNDDSSLDIDANDLTDNGDGTYTLGIEWTPDNDDIGDHTVTIIFEDESDAELTVTFEIDVNEDVSDEEQDVIDLENDYDDLKDDYEEIHEEYEDAVDDEDEDEIEDLEDDLDDLDDDLEDLDDKIDDLQSDLKDKDDDDLISDDLYDDLKDRLEELEEDVKDLREDAQDLKDDGISSSSSSATSSTDGDSAAELSEGSSASTTTTSSTSDDEEESTTTVTTLTSTEGSSTSTSSSSDSSTDDFMSLAWLIAGVVIAFAVLVFFLALLVSGPRRKR